MGAPNVYDTRYVNSGPGVGLSSNSSSGGSAYSSSSNGNTFLDDTPGYVSPRTSTSLAQSISNAIHTNPVADFVRETYQSPYTSAMSNASYSATDWKDQMDEYYDRLLDINDFNNEWSAEQAQKQMDYQTTSDRYAMSWSAQEAQKSREWTESLSNTAHQREIKDLVKAGLNPILAANNGAYSGSGATGQGFSSSGAMGQTDMSAGQVLGSMLSGIISTARDLAVTKMSMAQQKYNTDMSYAMSKLAAGASIYNNNNTVSAQKAISALNRDADIKKASISADATRSAASMSAGAITSAAATNAAAARYSADQHLEASKYGSDTSSEASKYGSDKTFEGTKYKTDNDVKNNPVGYAKTQIENLADAFSDRDNVYTPDLGEWNYLGTE